MLHRLLQPGEWGFWGWMLCLGCLPPLLCAALWLVPFWLLAGVFSLGGLALYFFGAPRPSDS
ncbi:MAG: hypothetical protein PW734_06695 [Verrucomicrobium sp.]|nr:hypothetical protein [Verrucomicrobium sp.]